MTFLYAIHGNLQSPQVWAGLEAAFPEAYVVVDLWESCSGLQLDDACWDWTKAFCGRVEMERRGEPAWLLGYSLGGRLALHALLHAPHLWRGVIAIGANPGLSSESEKASRLAHDQHWGERFRTEPWDELIREWDAQPVFQRHGTPIPNPCPPQEAYFDREKVAQLFDIFSLGRQDDLRPRLAELYTAPPAPFPEADKLAPVAPPLLYLSGQFDTKFRAFGDELTALGPGITHHVIPGAGHRVPWEQPEAFTQAVRMFIASAVS